MSQVRTIALICLILLLPQAVLAQDLVRVEVLVFKYNNGQSDRWPVDELDDFSALIDPRERARLAALAAPGADTSRALEAPAEAPGTTSTPSLSEPLTAEARDPVLPERYTHDEQLSANMQRALDRLRASSAHEVLSVTTWLQPLDRRRAAPAIRVRDDVALSIDLPLPSSPAFTLETGLSLPEQAPPPAYRLDGSVRIRQRQFRHAELNLVWSESRAQAAPGSFSSAADFEIHRLRQSRPIQLGRIEYFDSPWLGALILVEPWRAPASAPSDTD